MFDVKVVREGESKPIDKGVYDAVIIGVLDMGIHQKSYKGVEKDPQRVIRFIFEIPSLVKGEGDKARTQVVGKSTNFIISEKSNLFKYLKSLRIIDSVDDDKKINEVFVKDGGVEKHLLNKPVSLTIDHFKTPDGKVMHYVDGVNYFDPRLPDQPKATKEVFAFSTTNPNLEVFKNHISLYDKKTIVESLSGKDLPKEIHEAYLAAEEASKSDKASTSKVDEDEIV